MSLVHISLFSGIGGFETAMAAARIPTLAACEIDKAARGVLADHWPDTHIYTDVKEVTGDSLRHLGADPRRTVLTAGWPCQGNSVAGRRGGMGDARSGLWSEVARILAEFRPAWFVGENVPGLLSVAGGWDYATVIGDLARLGYGFAWRILDARHFGVPQRRRRIVLVGRLGDTGRAPAQVLLEPESGSRNPAQGITPRPIFARHTGGGVDGAQHPYLTASYGEQTHQDFDAAAFSGSLPVSATGRLSHALTAEGHDASEDGTGRGTPIVAFALRGRDEGAMPEVHDDGSTVGSLRASGGGSSRDYIAAPMYAADKIVSLDTAQGGPDDNAAQGGHLVAYQQHGTNVGPMGTLRAGNGGLTGGVPFIPDLTGGMGVTVRRLTPRIRECERLQGYPDGHTQIGRAHV
mgnify:FL=1